MSDQQILYQVNQYLKEKPELSTIDYPVFYLTARGQFWTFSRIAWSTSLILTSIIYLAGLRYSLR